MNSEPGVIVENSNEEAESEKSQSWALLKDVS